MRYILTIVEQLDRAATELKIDHAINNRLALILIDNATELMLHRQCIGLLERDRTASNFLKTHQAIANRQQRAVPSDIRDQFTKDMMTQKQKRRALSGYFTDKTKVLHQIGDLTRTERRFVDIAHGYRNELYHVGLSHDDVVRSIAGQYFSLSCDLFIRLGNLGYWSVSFSSNDEFTDIARRYLPMANGRIDPLSVEKEDLAEKLRNALPDSIPNLTGSLADSARQSILSVMENFEFLVRDNPFSFDSETMFEVAQWQLDLQNALEKKNVDGLWIDPDYQNNYNAVADSLQKTWQQQCKAIPQEKWMSRASAIENESDPLVAMEMFHSLRNDMCYIETAIETASDDLDRHIQGEIDRSRGK